MTFRFCSPHSIKLVYIENTLLRNDGASAILSGRSVAKHSSPMNATRLDVVKLTPLDHRERYIVSSHPACRSHFTSWQSVPARQSIEAKRRLSSQVRTDASTATQRARRSRAAAGTIPFNGADWQRPWRSWKTRRRWCRSRFTTARSNRSQAKRANNRPHFIGSPMRSTPGAMIALTCRTNASPVHYVQRSLHKPTGWICLMCPQPRP